MVLRSYQSQVLRRALSIVAVGLLAPAATAAPPTAGAGPAALPDGLSHQLARRIVVFPIEAPKELAAAADDAWWQMREELTKNRRFLVASKQFLLKSDAFQARSSLEPADAILLGKLLDAHALITARLDGRTLTLSAYDGSNGVTLWRREHRLLPSAALREQLASAARKVIDDFVASSPYQGFQVVDPLYGAPVFREKDRKLAEVDLGSATGAQVGDDVQWIRLSNENLKPLFQGGGKMTVFAEGRISKVEQGIATVELLRLAKGQAIKEFDLVRLPREYERLQKLYAIQDGLRTSLSPELVALEAAPLELVVKERRPLATVASWVGSIAALLLLAF